MLQKFRQVQKRENVKETFYQSGLWFVARFALWVYIYSEAKIRSCDKASAYRDKDSREQSAGVG